MEIRDVTVYRRENLAPTHHATGDSCEFTRRSVVESGSAGRCQVRFYELPPGKANYPYHYHETHEEVFYILSGAATLITPQGEQAVAPGDVVVCPPGPGGAHRLRNDGKEPFTYLEFDAVSFPDIAHYPRTGCVGVITGNKADNLFFRRDDRVDYARDVEGGGS